MDLVFTILNHNKEVATSRQSSHLFVGNHIFQYNLCKAKETVKIPSSEPRVWDGVPRPANGSDTLGVEETATMDIMRKRNELFSLTIAISISK